MEKFRVFRVSQLNQGFTLWSSRNPKLRAVDNGVSAPVASSHIVLNYYAVERRPAEIESEYLWTPSSSAAFSMSDLPRSGARLDTTFRGIERWQGSQEEVVLKETTVANDEIVSLGAFRQLNDAVPFLGARDPKAPSDEQIFRELTGKAADEHFWTSPESAATGVRNVANRVQGVPRRKASLAKRSHAHA